MARHGADVIVVGGGPAGLLAAIEAADAGADTLLLEAEPKVGGSGALAAGQTTLCETDFEPGDRQLLLEDLRRAHRGDHVESLAQLYVDEAGETYRRLRELGVSYARSVQLAHMSRPWAHEMGHGTLGGAAIVEALHAAAVQRGVRIATSMRMRRLIADRSGRLVAVRTKSEAGEVELDAEAVILTTGGFTRNRELIKHFGTAAAATIRPITGPASRGDGLLAAMQLGAGLSYIGQGIGPTAPVDPQTDKGTLIFYCGGIILNVYGRRFVDESGVYSDISTAAMSQPGGAMVHIYDSRCEANFAETIWASVDSLNGYEQVHADTVDELMQALAVKTSFEAAVAARTLEDYNFSASGSGQDEFGRQHLVGQAGDTFPLVLPPFHAAITVPGTTHFNGGLAVNDRLEVLDTFGQPIGGLFAAGEIVGGFHGAGYMSGTQWGQAVVFGRHAGRMAASQWQSAQQSLTSTDMGEMS